MSLPCDRELPTVKNGIERDKRREEKNQALDKQDSLSFPAIATTTTQQLQNQNKTKFPGHIFERILRIYGEKKEKVQGEIVEEA